MNEQVVFPPISGKVGTVCLYALESLCFAEAYESGWQAPGSHTSTGLLQGRGLGEEGSAWPSC